jgi:hypothetical protein
MEKESCKRNRAAGNWRMHAGGQSGAERDFYLAQNQYHRRKRKR